MIPLFNCNKVLERFYEFGELILRRHSVLLSLLILSSSLRTPLSRGANHTTQILLHVASHLIEHHLACSHVVPSYGMPGRWNGLSRTMDDASGSRRRLWRSDGHPAWWRRPDLGQHLLGGIVLPTAHHALGRHHVGTTESTLLHVHRSLVGRGGLLKVAATRATGLEVAWLLLLLLEVNPVPLLVLLLHHLLLVHATPTHSLSAPLWLVPLHHPLLRHGLLELALQLALGQTSQVRLLLTAGLIVLLGTLLDKGRHQTRVVLEDSQNLLVLLDRGGGLESLNQLLKALHGWSLTSSSTSSANCWHLLLRGHWSLLLLLLWLLHGIALGPALLRVLLPLVLIEKHLLVLHGLHVHVALLLRLLLLHENLRVSLAEAAVALTGLSVGFLLHLLDRFQDVRRRLIATGLSRGMAHNLHGLLLLLLLLCWWWLRLRLLHHCRVLVVRRWRRRRIHAQRLVHPGDSPSHHGRLLQSLLHLLLSQLLLDVQAERNGALGLLTELGVVATQRDELLANGAPSVGLPLAGLRMRHHPLHLVARRQPAVCVSALAGVD